MSHSELWVSDNPPWGVVRAVVVREPYAVVLDDLNGDFREVEATLLRRDAGHWQSLAYQDDAGMPGHDDAIVVISNGSVVVAVGRDRPHAEVQPSILAHDRAVVCDAAGFWFVAEEGVDPDDVVRRPSAPWL